MTDAERRSYLPPADLNLPMPVRRGLTDDVQDHVHWLRSRALICRGAAAMPINGSHETDQLLRDMADRLEREADEIERW